MFYRICYGIAFAIFCPLNRLKVVGREKIPQGAAVICPNHTALNDPIFLALGLTLRNRPQFMTKIELTQGKFWGKLFGWFLRHLGVFFVDRGKSALFAMKHSLQVIKQSQKLVIFPEGTRVREGMVSDAKGGAVMVAQKTGAPVVPVYITPGHKRPFTKVVVRFGEPYHIALEGRPTSEDYERCADELMEKIFALGVEE